MSKSCYISYVLPQCEACCGARYFVHCRKSLVDQPVLKSQLCLPLGELLLLRTDPYRVIHCAVTSPHPTKSLRVGPLSSPWNIISQQASCSSSSAKHHLGKHYIFQLLVLSCVKKIKNKKIKNAETPVPTVMDWNPICSAYCEQEILDFPLKPSCVFSFIPIRFSEHLWEWSPALLEGYSPTLTQY